MTAIDFHEYFPYDSGLGSSSSESRWRKMATVWAVSGVVAGLNYSMIGDAVTVQPGAVWVGGNYAELTEAVTIGFTTGYLVARNDTVASKIELTVVPGTVTSPPQDTPTIFYATIALRVGTQQPTDQRRFIDSAAEGLLQHVQTTNPQSGIPGTTWTDLTGMSVSYRLTRQRRLRIVAGVTYLKSVADGTGIGLLAVRNGDTSVEIRRAPYLVNGGAGGVQARVEHLGIYAAGVHSFKASAYSFTSWLNTESSVTNPGYMYLEDIGRP